MVDTSARMREDPSIPSWTTVLAYQSEHSFFKVSCTGTRVMAFRFSSPLADGGLSIAESSRPCAPMRAWAAGQMDFVIFT